MTQSMLSPSLLSFDVFGTLVDVRAGSYGAFRAILRECGALNVDVKAFWEHWEERNIAHYWEPYRSYKDICALSLAETLHRYQVRGDPALIRHYFGAFANFEVFPDVMPALDALSRKYRLALVSNIDDDLLDQTPLNRAFGLHCTAQRARGYKPDGTLFQYLIAHAGVPKRAILHSGQSQFTDMVGAKPLGLTVAWINRRGVALHESVPRPDFTLRGVGDLLPLLETGVTGGYPSSPNDP
jgi:2-haloacid dehalogenase